MKSLKGDTYHIKEELKLNFKAKWNSVERSWFVKDELYEDAQNFIDSAQKELDERLEREEEERLREKIEKKRREELRRKQYNKVKHEVLKAIESSKENSELFYDCYKDERKFKVYAINNNISVDITEYCEVEIEEISRRKERIYVKAPKILFDVKIEYEWYGTQKKYF